jgi:hypothetical protein
MHRSLRAAQDMDKYLAVFLAKKLQTPGLSAV